MVENAYTIALQQFDKAIRYLNLKAGIAEYLRTPKRELTVNFPVAMDDGSVRIFTGYRIHHNTARQKIPAMPSATSTAGCETSAESARPSGSKR